MSATPPRRRVQFEDFVDDDDEINNNNRGSPHHRRVRPPTPHPRGQLIELDESEDEQPSPPVVRRRRPTPVPHRRRPTPDPRSRMRTPARRRAPPQQLDFEESEDEQPSPRRSPAVRRNSPQPVNFEPEDEQPNESPRRYRQSTTPQPDGRLRRRSFLPDGRSSPKERRRKSEVAGRLPRTPDGRFAKAKHVPSSAPVGRYGRPSTGRNQNRSTLPDSPAMSPTQEQDATFNGTLQFSESFIQRIIQAPEFQDVLDKSMEKKATPRRRRGSDFSDDEE